MADPVSDTQSGGQLGGPTSGDARGRSFLEAALDCVLFVDEFGRVVEFNPSAERVFGYAREEALGRTLGELIVPPALRASHELAFARFVRTGEKRPFGRRVELTAMRSDGSEFPVELALSQVEGEPLLICGAVRDLTETKRAEEDLRRLADEQHLLRRVATLVACGSDLEEVVETICSEAGRLVGANEVQVVHYRPDGVELALAGWSLDGGPPRRPVRPRLSSTEAEGEVSSLVLVDGAVWGRIYIGADHPLPATTAESVASLAELTAISVANANARSELIASRARIVAAADDARRRLQRDIHDGAQQRLVTSLIHLQLADERMDSDPAAARRELGAAIESAKQGINELRDLAAGLHPTVLTRGGLGAALDALAARSPLPVTVDAPGGRYPAETEAAVYFLVAEALTNVSKHARASRADILVVDDATSLAVVVSDDGVGGARLDAGRGLRGLRDRIVALGGSFSVDSGADQGTLVRATLPQPGGQGT